MNKKGMTLIELLISIAMLSVALVFIYSLLVNLQNKKNANDNYTDDLIKIAEIETQIQKELFDFVSFGTITVQEIEINSSEEKLEMKLSKNSGGTTITQNKGVSFTDQTITITDLSNGKTIKKWNLDSNVASIDVVERSLLVEDSSLLYQYNVYLLDNAGDIVNSINIPLCIKYNNINITSKVESS